MIGKAIIFGAGKWGKMAYYYFEDVEIICYVDNNPKLWGTMLCDKEVCSPYRIEDYDMDEVHIIIANSKYKDEIREQLWREFGVKKYIDFGVSAIVKKTNGFCSVEDVKIVRFKGGLGNQLFQYAFLEYLKSKGCNTAADLDFYYNFGVRRFELDKVFSNVEFEEYQGCVEDVNKRKIYVENEWEKMPNGGVVENFLYGEYEYYDGYWQSYAYIKDNEEKLRTKLEFVPIRNKFAMDIASDIKKSNSVSIHIRLGDYLKREVSERFGGVCTKEYYVNAIRYIKQHTVSPKFYVFSNDIEMARDLLTEDGLIFVEYEHSEKEDWIDMYLMSQCKHNIIANSTFSWWSAWLNKNEKKIVIAPDRWTSIGGFEDICPTEWVRIEKL